MAGNSQQPDHSPTPSDPANCQGEIPANPLGNQGYGDWSKDSDISVPMTRSVKSVTVKHLICLKKNPLNSKRLPPWITNRGNTARDSWKIVFPELPHQQQYWYLLVLFTEHLFQVARSFPLLHQQGQESHQGAPQRDHTLVRSSYGDITDWGPHFISEVLQQCGKQLGMSWDLRAPWGLQSSRRVE